MSKDIRAYFSKVNGSSSTKSKVPEVSSPKNKKRVHRVIESDDEDDFVASSSLKKKQKEVETNEKSKSQQKKPEVVVQVENFFGSTPVFQKKQPVTSSKKSSEKNDKTTTKKEKKSKTSSKKKDPGENDSLVFENDEELEASFLLTDEELLMNSASTSDKKVKKSSTKDESKSPKGKSPRKEREQLKTPKRESGNEKEKKTSQVKITPVKVVEEVKIQNKTPKREEGSVDASLISSEQKRKNAEAYQKYLNRSGPKNPGSKPIPKGSPKCLQGLTFVITGVLDSLEREEAVDIIQKCGGRVTSQVSKKTDFVVVGEEPGVSKMQKAEKCGTKQLTEDELLNLIRERSEDDGHEEDTVVKGTPEKTSKYFVKEENRKRAKTPEEVEEETEVKTKIPKEEKNRDLKTVSKPSKASPLKVKSLESSTSSQNEKKITFCEIEKSGGDMLWVDKYKPKSTKNIVGQGGEKSNVKKLIKWLQNWHKNHSGKGNKKLTRPAPWAQNDDGSFFKAALLSGPPGVGKTTSVNLVCQELGLDIIEFNASDTRSKRLLQEEVSELLSTRSIRGFLQGTGDCYQKHVLVMDEVDGMAGNEDRGGIQELIQLIKNTKVPIVGICNDRNHPKMRSLVNYCFDLKFQRPRVEQIKGAMKSICFKENLNISGEALEELIISSNHDVRQVLHSLSLLASDGNKALSFEEAKKTAQQAKKPMNLSAWDVVRKVFSASEQEKMSLMDKSDLFFQDYSLGPLFVQDTYLRVKPYKAKNCKKKALELISKAADSLVLGDVVERTIRTHNSWSLLPIQAMYSSVIPGHHMSGHVQGQIQFPVWLGKNSKKKKMDRLLQELHSSLMLNISGGKESVNFDYLHHIKDSIVNPLVKDGPQGVQESLRFMLNYHLSREDLDSILELSTWPGVKDPFSNVDSKVKAALTRALNKECQTVSHTLKKNVKVKNENNFGEEFDEELEEEEESQNLESDPLIKKGKPKTVSKDESTSKGKTSKKETTKKGKERGKK